jgi:type I restriction enzyme S subunit
MTPEGWESRRVGELIINIGDGGTPRRDNPSYFGGDIPWVVIQDIKPLITVTKNSLTKEGLDACSAKLWPKNAVILSTGATIGEVGIAGVPLATKQGITGMVCKEYVIPKFLYYLLQQKKQYLQTLAQGSTIREVRPPILEKTYMKFFE